MLTWNQQKILLLVCSILCLVLCLPMFFNFSAFLDGLSDLGLRLFKQEFLAYLWNTLSLAFFSCFIASLIGGAAAIGIFYLEPKYRKFWELLFYLPLIFPAYVLAFVFSGAFSPGSDLQMVLRESLPSLVGFLPSSDSPILLYFSLGIVLSPYVFINLKFALQSISQNLREAAYSLSSSRWFRIKKLYLPALFPWWKEACVLVIMECIADFGAVAIFNYDSFTLAIYKAWFGYFSLDAARELSSGLVIIVFALLLLAKWAVIKRIPTKEFKFSSSNRKIKTWKKLAVSFSLCLLWFVCVGLPVIQLILWAMDSQMELGQILGLLKNSASIAIYCALILAVVSILFAILARFNKSILSGLIQSTARLSYAIPGTVLAVGCYYPLSQIDHWLSAVFNKDIQIFIGSILITIVALCIRYFNVVFTPVSNALTSLNPSVEEAGMGLGHKAFSILRKIHIPIILPVLFHSLVLLIIDVLKEMPIQLMTRSYGWDGISVKIYEFTSEGEWEMAAAVSLVLIVAGLVPVILLTRVKHEN